MSEANEMTELAKASFYIQDVMKGRLGEFTIEEDGAWGSGDGPRAYQEVRDCLAALDMDGWQRDDKAAMLAPYTHNVKVALLKKKFDKPIGWRWVAVSLTERFGVHCEFKITERNPWQ
jgi:hypothetical protein